MTLAQLLVLFVGYVILIVAVWNIMKPRRP